MSSARIDDRMAFHPKILCAGNEAVGAWIRMIAHCVERRTRGLVRGDTALSIAPTRILAKLVTAHLLERDGEHYRIHDFEQWNPPVPPELSEKRSEAGRRGAESKRNAGGKPPANGQQTPSNLPSKLPAKPLASGEQTDGNLPGKPPANGQQLASDPPSRARDLGSSDLSQDPDLKRLKSSRDERDPGLDRARAGASEPETGSGTFLASERAERETESERPAPLARVLPDAATEAEHRARRGEQLAALAQWDAEQGGGCK